MKFLKLFLVCSLVAPLSVLITGGTGFIGSHTAIALIEAGHRVTIMDDLSNSKISVLDSIEQITGIRPDFYQLDCANRSAMEPIFRKKTFDAVVHMAGFKAVGESVLKPLKYYKNNLETTLSILAEVTTHNISKFIFSSSATVYGQDATPGYTEDMPTGRSLTNPYTKTKYMIEQILQDYSKSNRSFQVSILRYFNPIGAHPSGLIGEDPSSPATNLMPVIMQVAMGELDHLEIYGDDYPTRDGTCLRDYIHVMDLAEGHLMALESSRPGIHTYNLGRGEATSVFELVSLFEKISKKVLPKRVVGRRQGDIAVIYANVSKAFQELHWKAKFTPADAIKDTLTYLGQHSQIRWSSDL